MFNVKIKKIFENLQKKMNEQMNVYEQIRIFYIKIEL